MSSQIAPSETMPSETDARSNRSDDALALEEDARLRTDIRLLGRILGDTVRDQEGAEGVRPGRAHPADLDPVPPRRGQVGAAGTRNHPRQHVDRRYVRIVRAFSYFSHLANIAEDQNNIRQMRGWRPRRAANEHAYPDTVRHAKTAGFSAAELRGSFRRCPGKSGADGAPDRSPPQEHDGPRDGDRGATRPARTDEDDAGGGRRQRRATAPCRADAVADQSAAPDQADRARRGRQWSLVLRLHVPARGAAAALRAGGPAEPGGGRASGKWPPSWTMGSWIGGDRDGNPFVTADVMRGTLRLQSSRVMSFYLEQLHALGAGVSLAAHLADVSDELRGLAGRSPDSSPHRSGEPYRLAVSGIYARLTATALRLEVETTRRPVGEAAPYTSVKEFKADLDVLDRSLIANKSSVIARGPAAAVAARRGLLRLPSRPGSTSGRIRPCMNARSQNCSTPRSPACPIWRSARKPVSICC